MRCILLAATLTLAAVQPVRAQDAADPGADAASVGALISAAGPAADVQAVHDVVVAVFDGMRAGDSAAVRPLFHPEARLITTSTRAGEPSVIIDSVDGWLDAIGAPHEEVYDERIDNIEIRVDDNLAFAWMDYAFHVGDAFSHCGVNLFQLVRTVEGWRVIEVADTRRRSDC